MFAVMQAVCYNHRTIKKKVKTLNESFNCIIILYIGKKVVSELGKWTNTVKIWSVDSLHYQCFRPVVTEWYESNRKLMRHNSYNNLITSGYETQMNHGTKEESNKLTKHVYEQISLWFGM